MKKLILILMVFLLIPLAYAQSTVQWNVTFDDDSDLFGNTCLVAGGFLNCSSAEVAGIVHKALNISDPSIESHTIEVFASFRMNQNNRRAIMLHARNTTAQLTSNWDLGTGTVPDIALRGSTDLVIFQETDAFELIKIVTHRNQTVDAFVNGIFIGSTNFMLGSEVSNSSWVLFNLDDNGEIIVDWIAHYNTTETGVAVPPDTTNPTFGSDSINNSNPKINEVVALSQVVQDETELSSFRFSHNISGSFVNQSPVSISGTSQNATFNLTVTLPQGNVIGYQWHTADSSGNINITSIASFTVANTPPETPTIILPLPEITNVIPLQMEVTFPSDADGDSITINYFIDDILNQTSATNTTLNASDGTFTLDVSISDGIDSSANATVTFTIDLINPINVITSPINNSINGNSVEVDISCSNLALEKLNYTFFQGDTIVKSVQNSSTGTSLTIQDTIDTSALSSGVFTMNITCTDNASNTDFEFLNLNIDNTNPAISVVSGDLNPTVDDVLEFNATCTDANGINSISISNNASGSLTNITIVDVTNITPFIYLHNHTVVLGTVAHQFTCLDSVDNSIQSGLISYNSSGIPVITSFEGTGTSGILVKTGAVAITLMVLFGVFSEIVLVPIRNFRNRRKK